MEGVARRWWWEDRISRHRVLPAATGVGGGPRLLAIAVQGDDERRTGKNAALHGWPDRQYLSGTGRARDEAVRILFGQTLAFASRQGLTSRREAWEDRTIAVPLERGADPLALALGEGREDTAEPETATHQARPATAPPARSKTPGSRIVHSVQAPVRCPQPVDTVRDSTPTPAALSSGFPLAQAPAAIPTRSYRAWSRHLPPA